MKNKLLILIILILLPVAVISFVSSETNFNLDKKNIKKEEQKTYSIKLKDSNNNIKTLSLEEYIIGVVAGEMPASFEKEALKAQAIASRTYAMYKKGLNNDYDVVTTTSDQVYLTQDEMKTKWQEDYSKYYNKIKSAVDSTEGLVIKYNNEIIVSYYFAMSNGQTEDAINVFSESKDYLISVESMENEDKVIQTKEISKSDFCQQLDITCENITINNLSTTTSGRVNKITINNKQYTGVEVRKLLDLRSTDFTININKDNVLITTKGYGHGVGMSQYGANEMAKLGSNYQEIIKHYYQDVTINKI